jgi:hypothetical protein
VDVQDGDCNLPHVATEGGDERGAVGIGVGGALLPAPSATDGGRATMSTFPKKNACLTSKRKKQN